MPKKTYIVKAGDTLPNVSRVAFGVPNRTEDIISSNPKLDFRKSAGNTDLSGNPNLETGEVLSYVIEPSLAQLQNETLGDVVDESVPVLHLNGVKYSVPDGSTATINFDTCCNTFGMSKTWDPQNAEDKALWGSPAQLPEYDLFLGSRKISGGKFEKIEYSSGGDASRRSVQVDGRTFTSALLKNNFPFSAYPLERKNETLTQIVGWACTIWSLQSEGSPVINEKFKKASAENSSIPWEFISNLATQRNSVLHTDNSGYAIQIVTPEITNPVVYWEHGVNGFELPDVRYDTTRVHDTHIGLSETAKKPKDQKTFEYPILNDSSFKYHELENQTDGTTADALRYQAIKTLRDFFTTVVSRPGLLNDDGQHWNVGDIVAIKAPHAAIFDFTKYMVRSVTYFFDVDGPQVELALIPPEVYLGQTLDRFPWVG